MDELLDDFLLNDERLIGLVDCLMLPCDWGKEKAYKQLIMDLNFIFLSNKED